MECGDTWKILPLSQDVVYCAAPSCCLFIRCWFVVGVCSWGHNYIRWPNTPVLPSALKTQHKVRTSPTTASLHCAEYRAALRSDVCTLPTHVLCAFTLRGASTHDGALCDGTLALELRPAYRQGKCPREIRGPHLHNLGAATHHGPLLGSGPQRRRAAGERPRREETHVRSTKHACAPHRALDGCHRAVRTDRQKVYATPLACAMAHRHSQRSAASVANQTTEMNHFVTRHFHRDKPDLDVSSRIPRLYHARHRTRGRSLPLWGSLGRSRRRGPVQVSPQVAQAGGEHKGHLLHDRAMGRGVLQGEGRPRGLLRVRQEGAGAPHGGRPEGRPCEAV